MDDSTCELPNPEPRNSIVERSGPINVALFNSKFDHVDVLDARGDVIESNRAFRELCNSYGNFLDHCRTLQEAGNEGIGKIMEGIASVLSGKRELYQSDYQFKTNSMTTRWYALQAQSLEAGKVLLTHRDITRRKLLEEEVLGISEREQTRLAQALHDGLCQVLNGMTLTIAVLADSLRLKNAPESDEIEYLLKTAQIASQQMRQLYHRVAPMDHGDDALCVALHHLTRRINQKIPCIFTSAPDITIPKRQIASLLYQIAQEASSEAEQLAMVKKIVIRLLTKFGNLILEIRDDGSSIHRNLEEWQGKFDLLGYRASLFGARLRLVSEPGHGNKVICIIPRSIP
jgi:signal transduction histidine kinase